MNLLTDIITYVRRIIKSPSNAVITDNLIVDYINRFWLMDIDARIQLFDLKVTYQFQTVPGRDKYNMPLYNVQPDPLAGNTLQSPIGIFPVYQGFFAPARINGINVPLYTVKSTFLDLWPDFVQGVNPIGIGNGGSTYTLQLPFAPNLQPSVNALPSGIIPGHVDIAGIIATGVNQDPPIVSTLNTSIPTTSLFAGVYFTTIDATGASIVISDSGQFLQGNVNYGLLLRTGNAPFGNVALSGGYSTTSNTINYLTGIANVTFTNASGAPLNIPAGQNINAQAVFYSPGLPRAILFYNNCLWLRSVPDIQYLVELDCYLTPAAFLSTGQAIPFGYMAEYIARGAARKILADTGDTEQFLFYEPLFKEQETLVWKRSQRQFTATRTDTIYSNTNNGANTNYNTLGQT